MVLPNPVWKDAVLNVFQTKFNNYVDILKDDSMILSAVGCAQPNVEHQQKIPDVEEQAVVPTNNPIGRYIYFGSGLIGGLLLLFFTIMSVIKFRRKSNMANKEL